MESRQADCRKIGLVEMDVVTVTAGKYFLVVVGKRR